METWPDPIHLSTRLWCELVLGNVKVMPCSGYHFYSTWIIQDQTVAEEDSEPIIQETKIEAEIPKINTDLGRQLHFIKLPNFLSVETRPFDRFVWNVFCLFLCQVNDIDVIPNW